MKRGVRGLASAICVALVLQLAACGTIIHPERRGQPKGRIDPAIAVLDGVGLLLFIIPGVIAYAVDFATGAIYLPAGQTSMVPDDANDGDDDGRQKVVYVDPASLDAETIARVVYEETGLKVDVEGDARRVHRFADTKVLLNEMARTNENIRMRHTLASAAP